MSLQIKTILKPDGQFVQWDWLSPEGSSHPGFTDKQISNAIEIAFNALSFNSLLSFDNVAIGPKSLTSPSITSDIILLCLGVNNSNNQIISALL